jgi:nucleoid-associated protein YgaU
MVPAVVLAVALAAGCSPVSDEEMERLRGETEALAAELTRLKSESEMLDRALTSVYREKDRVVDRLNALAAGGPLEPEAPEGAEAPAAGDPAAAGGDAAAAGAEAAGPRPGTRPYTAQRGDTLSQIARRHNTTLQVMIDLNPRLASRPEYMVWESDILTVPNTD